MTELLRGYSSKKEFAVLGNLKDFIWVVPGPFQGLREIMQAPVQRNAVNKWPMYLYYHSL
jgi:hypothetical protein